MNFTKLAPIAVAAITVAIVGGFAASASPAHRHEQQNAGQVDRRPDDFENESFAAPQLSGTEETFDTVHFRIHFTRTGVDAVPSADADNNGTPDYVELVADTLEQVHDIEVNQLGWLAPPPDNGFGGNNLYDVYLQEMLSDGIAGFVDGGFEDTTVGDNSHSANVVETRSSFSLMGLDNDYVESDGFQQGVSTEDLMRTTVAHEYMHSIQMGYDGMESLEWLWESTATWIQDEVFDEVNDGDAVIEDFNSAPSSCQFEADPYGMWVLLRFISERFGHDTVRAMWENTVAQEGYEVVESALAPHGASFDDVVQEFAVALLLRDFDEGANYPVLRLEAAVSGAFTPESGVGQVGYDFLELNLNGVNTLSLDNLTGQVVGVANGQAQVFELVGGQATIDADEFDSVYLVVVNLNRAQSMDDCQAQTYTLSVQSGGQPNAASGQASADNFARPQVGESAGGGFGGGFGPDEVPDYLIPPYVPAGFEQTDLFEMESELGEFLIGVAYENAAGEFFEVAATETDYTIIDQWLNDADFDPFPDEFLNINGVRVFLADFSEPGDAFVLATFLLDGLRYEVSGSIAASEIRRIVDGITGGSRNRYANVPSAAPQEPRVSARLTHNGVAFTASSSGVGEMRVQIFSLAGERVFEQSQSTRTLHWSGLNQTAQPVANGVYLALVTVHDVHGNAHQAKLQKIVWFR